MLNIVQMKVDHIEAVLSIEKVAFSNPWSRFTFFNEILHNDYAHYLVAFLNGEIVAYGGIWLILDEAHITNIAVHPNHRRKGYGQQTLTALMSWAKKLGAASLTLEVRESNDNAQQLYFRNGFEARGRRKRYYSDNNEDAVVMWKDNLDDIPAEEVGEKGA